MKVFTKPAKGIGKKIGKVDAIFLFTDTVAHSLRYKIVNFARANGSPCFIYQTSGICTLRRCLDYLKFLDK